MVICSVLGESEGDRRERVSARVCGRAKWPSRAVQVQHEARE
jgi:hypothetical protein